MGLNDVIGVGIYAWHGVAVRGGTPAVQEAGLRHGDRAIDSKYDRQYEPP